MNHLIICREYPPASYPPGGIGTYLHNIARLLAEADEIVHVIAQLWEGASHRVEERHGGRLVVHRVPLDQPVFELGNAPEPEQQEQALRGLAESDFPAQLFSWQAALLAEALIESERIDVVEAQEWEAPLYYLLLRRAVGLGPGRRPPCIVHLHSPTEFIFRHNGWDAGLVDYLPAIRLEEYTVCAADALLCPSRYFARQAEAHYGLKASTIEVIPYPMGGTPWLKRGQETWQRGRICYVGRIETRKGIFDWLDAAVEVAADYKEVTFEFVGGDTPLTGGTGGLSVGRRVLRQIPKEMRHRFRFRGSQPRARVLQSLAEACAAVVPSRWENFPYSCIEAMSTGLPVIASPEGGMKELVIDGRSGWIAPDPGSVGLASALRRALETSGEARARMGDDAARTVRHVCDNREVVRRHLEFRSLVAARGAGRSLRLARNLQFDEGSAARSSSRAGGGSPELPGRVTGNGIGLVVTCSLGGSLLDECLSGIRRQTRSPAAVVVVMGEAGDGGARAAERARLEGCEVIAVRDATGAAARNAGARALFESGPDTLGVSFVSEDIRLQPGFVAACESVLESDPGIGIVSSWIRRAGATDHMVIRPCPALPYQWVVNDAMPHSGIRTEALRFAGLFRPELTEGLDVWDLFNAVTVAGWMAVTYPAVLAVQLGGHRVCPSSCDAYVDRRYLALPSRFPREFSAHAPKLTALLRSMILSSAPEERRYSATASSLSRYRASLLKMYWSMSPGERLAFLCSALRDPRRALRWLVWRLRSRARRAKRRVAETGVVGGDRR